MKLEPLIRFLTNKDGLFAALVGLAALVATALGIIRPTLERIRTKRESAPNLSLSNLKIEGPPPWSEAGKATFELVNKQGGKAVLSELLLIVLRYGVSGDPKMVETSAPVPQFTYKVLLTPGVVEYDVRRREFGAPAPHSFDEQEVESFVVEL